MAAPGRDLSDEIRALSGTPSDVLLDKAYNYMALCKFDSALICYSAITSTPYSRDKNESDVRNRVVALGNTGLLYLTYYYDYRKALSYFLQAKDLSEQHGLLDFIGGTYLNIANVIYYDNLASNHLDLKVIPYVKKAFDYAFQANSADLMISSLSNLIELNIETQNSADIVDYLDKFDGVSIPESAQLRDYILLEFDGMWAYINQDYTKAATLFMEASRNVVAEINPRQNQISALMCAAEILSQNELWEDAESAIKEAIVLAQNPENRAHALPLYGKLTKIYQDKGDEENEHNCRFRYLTLKDSLINRSQIGNARDAQFQHDINKANDEIKALYEKQHQQTMILVAAAAVAVVIMALTIRLIKAYRRIKENYKVIYQSNLDLLERERQLRQEHSIAKAHTKRYQQSRMTDNDTMELYGRVVNVFETSNEIFDMGFNAERLCELVQSKPRYVSQAIAKESGGNFNTLLNKYRVIQACNMLNDTRTYGEYTIEAIAESVGFRSRSNFSVVFKSITGLSPSVYQAMAKERHS